MKSFSLILQKMCYWISEIQFPHFVNHTTVRNVARQHGSNTTVRNVAHKKKPMKYYSNWRKHIILIEKKSIKPKIHSNYPYVSDSYMILLRKTVACGQGCYKTGINEIYWGWALSSPQVVEKYNRQLSDLTFQKSKT